MPAKISLGNHYEEPKKTSIARKEESSQSPFSYPDDIKYVFCGFKSIRVNIQVQSINKMKANLVALLIMTLLNLILEK